MMPTKISAHQTLRYITIIITSFICGFYIGCMQASNMCDHIIDVSVSITEPKPNQITNYSHLIQSNYFDVMYQWHFFPRNTELSPYIIPNHKIIFCGIAKNAISMWKMVILRLLDNNVPEWWLPTQRSIHSHSKNGLSKYRLRNMNFSAINQIINDPTWYKVVFIRDPLERALSGVLDKGFVEKVKFDHTFIEYLTNTMIERGPHKINQHLRPQHKFCDLYKYKDKYRILSYHNRTHRKQFLDDNGLWDTYGATGWHESDHDGSNTLGYKYDLTHFGSAGGHSKKASSYVVKMYSVGMLAALLEYYQYDYILFNLKVPDWICQVVRREYMNMIKFIPQQITKWNVLGIKRGNMANEKEVKKALIIY
eukprot:121530_1